MTSKRPKSTASSAGSRAKDHPDDILPMVLTSATQELFACRADEDLTGENPYKLLRKDDIVQDMKTRAAVSDFSPVKQIVLDYPEDEILLVFDRDFTYGQAFYLVLTPEAKDRILKPPEPETSEVSEVCEVSRTPEPKPWISLGSEQEIEEESVNASRENLWSKFSRVWRSFGAAVRFSDRNTADAKDGFMECASYQDERFNIKQMERDCGMQAVPELQSSSAQTQWKHRKNMYMQYEPREFREEEKESILQSESLKNFISSATPRVLQALQQNEIMDVFFDDWAALKTRSEDDGVEGMTSGLRVYQAFTDQQYCKQKKISSINWHPTINGVIAVAMTEKVSLEERFNQSTKFLLNPPLILFWSFSDPANPQLLLECPDDVFAFEFCPSDPNIIVGGCMNGQVVLWDISAHVTRLQGSRPGGGKNISINTDAFDFEEKRENETPVVRYCAVSAVESSHKALITDVQWLPQTFEVTKMGVPVESKNNICVQVVTCSPDCSLMFWDIRSPMTAGQPTSDRKQNVDKKSQGKPYGIPDTFKHLDRTWKPLFRVALPMIETSGEYSPLKFSLEDYTCDSHTGSHADGVHLHDVRSEVTPRYSQLRVPSAKAVKSLEDVNTKLYIGTEDGEIVYTDWKLEKDNDSGRIYSAKPLHCFCTHDWWVNTVQRSPFFKDIILTVGGWKFAIWKEDVMQGPILQSACSEQLCTVGYWSQSRPAVFFIGKEDGNIEVWDLLEKTHEPLQVHSITTARITCMKPWIFSHKLHFLAVSDDLGMLHILEIPWTLHSGSSNERLNVRKYFEAEVDRLLYFSKREDIWAQQKREMDAEELKKKTDLVPPVKTLEQIDEEDRKQYEQYLTLEKAVLKGADLLPATDNTQDM
ncbi:dynein axonemal intermediate chain 3 [Centroberyx gerrardi]